MLTVCISVAALLMVGLGAGVVLLASSRGGDTPTSENGASTANTLVPLRSEVERLEREVSELRRAARDLASQRDQAEREAKAARAELEKLLFSGKTGQADGWFDAAVLIAAWVQHPQSFHAAISGQVGSQNPQPPQQQGGQWNGQPAAFTEADRLNNLRRELRQERQMLFDEQQKTQGVITELKSVAKSLREKVASLRGFLNADLVLVQQGAHAVGIQVDESGVFVVAAKAEGELATYANQIAFGSNVLRVQDNSRLVRRLATQSTVGRPVPPGLTRDLIDYWKPRVYVPRDADTLVTFRDLNAGEHRVGFYREHGPDELRVATLRNANETVPRSRIEPGTALRGSAERLLARAPATDFIDFALLEVGRALSTDDKATYHRIAVQTKVDLSAGRLDRLAGYRPTRYVNAITRFLLEDDARRADLASGHFEKDRRLESIRNELEDRVVEKLHLLGIPILERENIAEVQIEQGIAGAVGPSDPKRRVKVTRERVTMWGATRETGETTLEGPSVEIADATLDVARTLNQPIPIEVPGTLSYATHVLVVEVADSASDEGSLRLATRLLDSRTGQVVWAGNADRPFYNPAVASDHMLGSGKLIAINRLESGRRIAGHKLPMPFDTAASDPLLSRVAYYEGKFGNDMLMRDLFSFRVNRVAASRVDMSKSGPVRAPDSVSEDNRMRHLMWTIAQAVRPTAGRVVRVEDGSRGEQVATVSCRQAGKHFRVGDSLTANRVERDYNGSSTAYLQRMPIDLTIRDMRTDGFVAIFDTTNRDALWSSEVDLKVNDIICGRGHREPLVAVTPPRLERPTNEDWNRLKLDIPHRMDDYRGWSADGADLLAQRLADTLSEMRTPVVELQEPSQAAVTGATHVVRGRIRPVPGKAFVVNLQVYETGKPDPLETVQVTLGREQLKRWRP